MSSEVRRSMALPQLLTEQFQPLTLVFLAIPFVILLNCVYTDYCRKQQLPPGPPKVPIIGNLHQLGNLSPHLSLHSLAKKYGPIIYLQLGWVPTVIISSAKLAKEILITYDNMLSNRPEIFGAKHLFYNMTDIAFSPYGAYWKFTRKICKHELFSIARVRSFQPIREEEVARMVRRIRESSSSGTVNLSRILAIYANSVLCRVAFGKDFTTGGDYESFGFKEMLIEYQKLIGGFSIGDFFPSIEEFLHRLTGITKRLQASSVRLDDIFNKILREHRDRRLEGSRKDEHKDFVDVLLDIQKDESSAETALTVDNVKAIIMDMFVAGTDTTFVTLDWAMTELVKNRKALEKATNEVRAVVGGKKFVPEAYLPMLPYLKATIKEIFRLHPPALLLMPRESMEEIALTGYRIPAKTRFFINVWSIGRDPETWEDPEKFRPERFLASPIDYKGQDFELIPFGASRRICLGVMFGAAIIELGLAQLLHSFDWELPSGVEPKDLDITEVGGITMHREAELVVVAKPQFD